MAANRAEPSRLLSVQSHVVSGYVGASHERTSSVTTAMKRTDFSSDSSQAIDPRPSLFNCLGGKST
jgi:hypothetical protein